MFAFDLVWVDSSRCSSIMSAFYRERNFVCVCVCVASSLHSHLWNVVWFWCMRACTPLKRDRIGTRLSNLNDIFPCSQDWKMSILNLLNAFHLLCAHMNVCSSVSLNAMPSHVLSACFFVHMYLCWHLNKIIHIILSWSFLLIYILYVYEFLLLLLLCKTFYVKAGIHAQFYLQISTLSTFLKFILS